MPGNRKAEKRFSGEILSTKRDRALKIYVDTLTHLIYNFTLMLPTASIVAFRKETPARVSYDTRGGKQKWEQINDPITKITVVVLSRGRRACP